MIVRWTAQAAEDITNIENWLIQEAGARIALRQILLVYKAIELLEAFPYSGTEAQAAEGRTLLAEGTPYLIHHAVKAEALVISRVRHSSRKPLKRIPKL